MQEMYKKEMSIELGIGDIVRANLWNQGENSFVVTDIIPSICIAAVLNEENEQLSLRPGGTLNGPVEVIGHLSVSSIIEGYSIGWADMLEAIPGDFSKRLTEMLEEQLKVGSKRYTWEELIPPEEE